MKNYLIVTDSTSALSVEDAKRLNIEMLPLNVIVNGKSYEDNIDINHEQLYQFIREGIVPTSSQPSIGLIEEKMQEWKDANYDAIIVIAVSSGLSGTYNAFCSAKEQIGFDNMHIIDCRTCAAPMRDAAIKAQQMVEDDCELEEILDMIKLKMAHTFSFLYPKDFVQLKKGGRVTPAAANVANLLKIKPLLYLANEGMNVDKFALARTNKKVFDLIVEEFKKQNITAEKYKYFILEADCKENAYAIETLLKKEFNDIECEIVALPAVLTCQGGLGCLAVQTALKV